VGTNLSEKLTVEKKSWAVTKYVIKPGHSNETTHITGTESIKMVGK
jgi:hypothetical protein